MEYNMGQKTESSPIQIKKNYKCLEVKGEGDNYNN